MNNEKLYRVCIISEGYPTEKEAFFTFVQQLAYSLSEEKCICKIVCPQSITKVLMLRAKPKKYCSIDYAPNGKQIKVIRPYTFSFSNTRNKYLKKLTNFCMKKAIKRGLKKAGERDIVYCYFWHMGLMTADSLLKNDNCKLIVQASECNITISPDIATKENINRIDGVICASRKNQKESIDAKLTTEAHTKIVVNGYRTETFHKMDKYLCREKMNMPQSAFIIAFVGGFIKRKGICELCEAIDKFDDVYSIFIGRGQYEPTCKNILFSGSVRHDEIKNYLNCADVFILPTRAEGCCNAIIEALACGLPVISSNKSFNDEILNDLCSIRINEENVDEIYEAIKVYKEDKKKLGEHSNAAIKKAETLTIDKRAKSIVKYFEEMNL